MAKSLIESPLEELLHDPEHQRRIEQIARKNTRGTPVPWEDAAQTAHAKIVQAVNAGKFCQGSAPLFYRWAATVARCAVIDLVRRELRQRCWSLDQPLPGSDLPLLETIASEGQPLDLLEQADLVQRAIASIISLDQRHPHRGYWQIWQGRVRGQTQETIAQELGVAQGTVSKRWRDLVAAVAQSLDSQPTPDQPPAQLRQRSPLHW